MQVKLAGGNHDTPLLPHLIIGIDRTLLAKGAKPPILPWADNAILGRYKIL
jgi:hypothetical protein